MPFDWIDYLDLAESLALPTGQAPFCEEARNRTAISRAYYAAFNVIIPTFHFHDKQSQHSQLINTLINHNNQQFSSLGHTLKKMHEKRVQADYRKDFPFNISDVNTVISQSRHVIKKWNEINKKVPFKV